MSQVRNIAFRRFNTSAEAAIYTGPDGTISIDKETDLMYLHDGVTAGGHLVNLNNAFIDKLFQNAYFLQKLSQHT